MNYQFLIGIVITIDLIILDYKLRYEILIIKLKLLLR